MVSVVCPKCRATLRSAVDVAGKAVRCQSCREKFRVPGGSPAAVAPPVSTAAPVAKAIPAKPVAATRAAVTDPFAFDDPTPSPVGQLSTIELPSEPMPALPATADLFAFGDPNGPVVSVPGASRRSKTALAGKDDKPSKRTTPAKKGGVPVGLIVGGLAAVALLVVGGGGFAACWFMFRAPEVAQAPLPTTAADKPPPADTSAPANDAKADRKNDKPMAKASENKRERGAAQAASNQQPGKVAAYTLTPPAADAKVVVPPRQTASLPVPFGTLKQVKIAGTNPPFAFVLRVKEAGFQGLGVKESVERYSLNGTAAGEVVVDADKTASPRIFDVSADGTKAVVEAPAGKLTVYDYEAKAKAWDGQEVGGPGRTGVAAAVFLTPGTLAVVDRSGAVDVWDVAGKKLAGMPGARPQSAGDGVVAAGRVGSQVAVAIGAKVYSFDAASTTAAKPLFELPTVAPLAVASDPADRRIAVVVGGGKADPKHSLVLGPAQVGGKPRVVPLPDALGTPSAVTWPSDAAVVVIFDKGAAAAVFDAETTAALAYLKAGGKAVQLAAGQAGRHWYAAADDADAGKTTFVAVEVPFDPASGIADEAAAGKKPVYLLPRADGLAK